MKILIFSDLHSKVNNILPVLKENKFDEYIFAGDLFGYFNGGKDVIELIIKYDVKFVLGNHDLYFLREMFPEWFSSTYAEIEKKMISSEEYNDRYGYLYSSLPEIKSFDLDFLKNTNLFKRISVDNLDILICHGSLQNPFDGYIYPDFEYFDDIFNDNSFDILIFGHSHKSFIKTKNDRFIINPGSCTLPRGNDIPTYAIFDSDEHKALICDLNQNLNFIRETKNKLKLN